MTLQELTKIRMSGQKPELDIVLSLIGPMQVANPVILVTGREQSEDMLCLRGLAVEVFFRDSDPMLLADLASRVWVACQGTVIFSYVFGGSIQVGAQGQKWIRECTVQQVEVG